jgi:cell division septum initiation protein DivIVA
MALDGKASQAALADEIRELEARIAPLAERLMQLRRRQAAVSAAQASIERRQREAAQRRERVIQHARRLEGRIVSGAWQQRIAETVGISTRQVRRILKDADINIGRWGSWP